MKRKALQVCDEEEDSHRGTKTRVEHGFGNDKRAGAPATYPGHAAREMTEHSGRRRPCRMRYDLVWTSAVRHIHKSLVERTKDGTSRARCVCRGGRCRRSACVRVMLPCALCWSFRFFLACMSLLLNLRHFIMQTLASARRNRGTQLPEAGITVSMGSVAGVSSAGGFSVAERTLPTTLATRSL